MTYGKQRRSDVHLNKYIKVFYQNFVIYSISISNYRNNMFVCKNMIQGSSIQVKTATVKIESILFIQPY